MFKEVLINQENYMENKGFRPTGKNTYSVVVVGAGASGLLFAAGYNNLNGGSSTDGRGFSGLIIDHNGKAGAKLLISGGGRCNFTHGGNIKDFPSHYHNGKKSGHLCTNTAIRPSLISWPALESAPQKKRTEGFSLLQ